MTEVVVKMSPSLKHYHGHRAEALLKKKVQIVCECGATTDYSHSVRHRASKLHTKLLNKINGIEEPKKVRKPRVKKIITEELKEEEPPTLSEVIPEVLPEVLPDTNEEQKRNDNHKEYIDNMIILGEIINCGCGSQINKSGLLKHERTKSHQKYLTK